MKFFHSMVKGKRKKLHINEIKDKLRMIVSTQDQIKRAAVDFYQEQLSKIGVKDWPNLMGNIPTIITQEENK